ncbi:MAG: hypothetical protein QXN55_02190 [Candidatus Nitrosotenuis sp.]
MRYEQIVESNKIILSFLEAKNEARFGEIQSELKKHKITYSKKGLFLTLQRLVSRKDISIHRTKQGHYLYRYSKKQDIAALAKEFNRSAYGLLNVSFPPFDEEDPLNRDNIIKDLVLRVGFFMIFSYLKALRIAYNKKDRRERYLAFSDWIDNCSPWESISDHFGNILLTFMKFGSKEDAFSSILSDLKLQELLIFDNILKRRFPNEFDFCDKRYNELFDKRESVWDSNYPEFKKSFDDWVRRLDMKMKKQQPKFDPPMCPRCKYDGEGPIKTGPLKGCTLLWGLSKDNFDGYECWYCPVCEYLIPASM